MIVFTITAILVSLLAMFSFYNKRTDIQVEEAAKDVETQIRLEQAQIMAVQPYDSSSSISTIPAKAVIIRLSTDGTNPNIRYFTPNSTNDCLAGTMLPSPAKEVNLNRRASIKEIRINGVPLGLGGTIYLVYTAPVGTFMATTDAAAINPNSYTPDLLSVQKNCTLNSAILVPTNQRIEIDFVDDSTITSQTYIMNIDSSTGNITIDHRNI